MLAQGQCPRARRQGMKPLVALSLRADLRRAWFAQRRLIAIVADRAQRPPGLDTLNVLKYRGRTLVNCLPAGISQRLEWQSDDCQREAPPVVMRAALTSRFRLPSKS
jgi:hypothetical protein